MKKYRKLYTLGGYVNDSGDPLTDLIGTKPWLAAPANKPIRSLKDIRMSNTPVPYTVTPYDPGKYMPVRQNTGTISEFRTQPDTPAPKEKRPGFMSKLFSNNNIDKINNGIQDITPFISNISNSFRRAPRPNVPVLDDFTTLKKVDFSDQRHQVRRTMNAAGKATERNVDANTAEAVKAFNRGQEFNQLSTINERENNINVGIGNQQVMMDAQVKASNTDRQNDYQTAKTAADIADQREQSANVANAGNKMVMIGNEKRKAQVERDKIRVLSSLFTKSGVSTRQNTWRDSLRKQGVKDPFGIDYADMESDEDYKKRTSTKKYGGMIGGIPSRKLN